MNETVAEALRQALAGRTDVRLAILFGSRARGTDRAGSDVDVAVLARGVDPLSLASDLTHELRREVPIVDLDAVGFPMLQAIVRDGVIVAENEKGCAARWRSRALVDLENDRPWFERMRDAYLDHLAADCRMTDRDVVTAKLAELEDRLGRVRANVRGSASELASDRDASDLVAFNLMLAVQTCLDVASHVFAHERLPPASTLAESFHRLAERGVITAETDAALGRAASFRNVVAHGYGAVVSDILFTAATDGVHGLERFAHEIATWMTRRPS